VKKIRHSLPFLFIFIFCLSSATYAQANGESFTAEDIAEIRAEITALQSRQNATDEVIQSLIRSRQQLLDYIGVDRAYVNYDMASRNVGTLETSKVLIEAKLEVAKYKSEDNWEEIKDGFISTIESIQIDPAGIISTATATTLNLGGDIGEILSLSQAVSTLKKQLADINQTIVLYQSEASRRETAYNDLKSAYEAKYGSFSTDSIPDVQPISYCARGQACQQKPGNFQEAEAHQVPCPDKIDGSFFGIGERDCTGHIYGCDPNYLCPRWDDHMIDSAGCEHDRYPRGEKDKHKLVANPPCNAAHSYYACNDDAHEFVKRGRCLSIKTFSSVYEYPWGYTGTRRVRCTNPSTYYKCTPHAHVYPRPSSSSY
jgi:hypothetical protein